MTTQEQPEIPTPVRVWNPARNGVEPHRCTIRSRVLYGFLTLLYDPSDLRVCLRTGDQQEYLMRLPWLKLTDARDLDGEAAAVHFDETALEGKIVDRTVFALRDVDPELVRDPAEVRRNLEEHWKKTGAKPMTGYELAERLRAVFDSDEERQAYVDDLKDLFPADDDDE